MVAKRNKGEIIIIKPYKTKLAAERTLRRLRATRTHRVALTRNGLYTIRKKPKGR